MPRLLAAGGPLLLVLGILAAVALTRGLGRSEPAPPSAAATPAEATTFDGVALTYRGPGQRSASYSSFQVQFTNGTAQTRP